MPEDRVVHGVDGAEVSLQVQWLNIESVDRRDFARFAGEGQDREAREDIRPQVAREGPDVGGGYDEPQMTTARRKGS